MRFLARIAAILALVLLGACSIKFEKTTSIGGFQSPKVARDLALGQKVYPKKPYIKVIKGYGYNESGYVFCYTNMFYVRRAYVHTPRAPRDRHDVVVLLFQDRKISKRRSSPKVRGELRLMPHPYREKCHKGDVRLETGVPIPNGQREVLGFEYSFGSEISPDARNRWVPKDRHNPFDPTYRGRRRR